MIIRKVHKQLLYPVGSIAAKFNGGRTISIIVSFCLSAVCMASLLLEAPKWDAAEKGIVVLAIVLYPIVECLVGRLAKREFEPAYQTAAKVRWSCVVVAILLCIGYAVWMFYDMSSGKRSIRCLSRLSIRVVLLFTRNRHCFKRPLSDHG